MRLKSFYTKTLKDAMQTIRETLGEDAIIVSSRDDPRGGGVHVTAALDDAPLGSPMGQRDDWLQYDDERDEQSIAEDLTDLMLFHGVPDSIMDEIVSHATVSGHESVAESLTEALTHLFFFDKMPKPSSKRPIIVVGSCGSGKTSVVARLAALASMEGTSVSVITTDTIKAGAEAQLSAFTKIMDIKLTHASSPSKLSALIAKAYAGGAQQVLIDTAGANPFNASEMRELAAIIKAAQGDAILTLPAGMDTNETGEAARIFAAAGARRFLPTRLDCARRLGSLLTAAQKGGVTFVGATITPSVAKGVIALTPKELSDIIINGICERDKKDAKSMTKGNAMEGAI